MENKKYFLDKNSLVCSICLDCYVENDPRTLPCQHTFCLECLKQLDVQNSQLTCPTCKEKSTLSENNISKISKNFISNSIKTVVKQKPCTTHDLESTFFCLDHRLSNLCEFCIDEEHVDCKVIPLITYLKGEKITTDLISKRKILNEKLLLEIDNIEKKYCRIIIEKCKSKRTEIEENFKDIEHEINEIQKKNLTESEKHEEQKVFCKQQENTHVQLTNFEFELQLMNESINKKVCGMKSQMDYLNIFDEFVTRLKDKGINIDSRKDGENGMIIHFITPEGKKSRDFVRIVNPFQINTTRRSGSAYFNEIIGKTTFISSLNYKLGNYMAVDLFSGFLDGLAKSSETLTEIYFELSCLTNDNYTKFVEFLNCCTRITTFTLFSTPSMPILQEIMINLTNSAKNLQEISFKNCKLDACKAKCIGKVLINCKYLKSINFDDNTNMEHGFFFILEGLKHLVGSLERLSFMGCKLNLMHLDHICQFIQNFDSLSAFLASFAEECSNFKMLFSCLKKTSKSITELKLNLELKPISFKSLTDLLKNCNQLKILHLTLIDSNKTRTGIANSLVHIRHQLAEIVLIYHKYNFNPEERNDLLTVFKSVKMSSSSDIFEKYHFELNLYI